MFIKLLCKYINKTKQCSRWIRWGMVGHLLWTTMWLQPSAGPVSIHRTHSLAFCWLDRRPRSASWTLSVSHCCLYSRPQTLHLSVSAPARLLQITTQISRPQLSHEGHKHAWAHTQTRTHTKLNYKDSMGRGSEREIGQSACTPPLLTTPPVLAGWESGTSKGTNTHTHTYIIMHTYNHTHTQNAPEGKRVFDKIEPVVVQRAWLRCVMSSTQPSHQYVTVLLIRVYT